MEHVGWFILGFIAGYIVGASVMMYQAAREMRRIRDEETASRRDIRSAGIH